MTDQQDTRPTDPANPTAGTAGTAAGPAKVPATRIALDRVEGPSASLGMVSLDGPDVWTAADARLSQWRWTAPTDGSYHKVDFTVTFADGATYTGRYDLEGEKAPDLADHIRKTAAFFAAQDPARLDRLANPPADWRALLDTYELGTPAPHA